MQITVLLCLQCLLIAESESICLLLIVVNGTKPFTDIINFTVAFFILLTALTVCAAFAVITGI